MSTPQETLANIAAYHFEGVEKFSQIEKFTHEFMFMFFNRIFQLPHVAVIIASQVDKTIKSLSQVEEMETKDILKLLLKMVATPEGTKMVENAASKSKGKAKTTSKGKSTKTIEEEEEPKAKSKSKAKATSKGKGKTTKVEEEEESEVAPKGKGKSKTSKGKTTKVEEEEEPTPKGKGKSKAKTTSKGKTTKVEEEEEPTKAKGKGKAPSKTASKSKSKAKGKGKSEDKSKEVSFDVESYITKTQQKAYLAAVQKNDGKALFYGVDTGKFGTRSKVSEKSKVFKEIKTKYNGKNIAIYISCNKDNEDMLGSVAKQLSSKVEESRVQPSDDAEEDEDYDDQADEEEEGDGEEEEEEGDEDEE